MDRIYRLLPYLALTAAAAMVVLLAAQKRALLRDYDDLNRRYRQAMTELRPGDYVPAFQTATLEGEPVTVGELPAPGRQVLLVYTTTCQYCLATIPAWKRIKASADTMRSVRASVYGVSLDSVDVTRKYVAEHALPYPTIRFPNEKLEAMYRAGAVPLTLVINEEGRTVYSRLGELKEGPAVDSVLAAIQWQPQPRDSARAAQPGRTAAR